MPKTTSEQNFENAIVADLVKLNGFHPAAPEDYDRELCLIPQSLVRFLQVTQPQAWKALRTELGDEAESRIVKRVRNVIEKKGTLHALRKGVDESGSHFDLCFFPPSGGGETELEKLYQGNFSRCCATRMLRVVSNTRSPTRRVWIWGFSSTGCRFSQER